MIGTCKRRVASEENGRIHRVRGAVGVDQGDGAIVKAPDVGSTRNPLDAALESLGKPGRKAKVGEEKFRQDEKRGARIDQGGLVNASPALVRYHEFHRRDRSLAQPVRARLYAKR